MKELVVATRNPGKLKEIRQLLEGHVCTLFSLADFQDLPHLIEDGDTFEKNAIKKARMTASIINKPVLADDSGLVVDILDGKPGIYSARFAGEGASDEQNNAKLLAELHGIPDGHRSAAFHCTVALCFPDGSCYTFSGELKGLILEEPRGSSGFGYDTLFFIPEYNKTLAELPHEVKNKISHRGKALANLKNFFLQSR
jgi:XTP/dITP diphosphohydrolase